MFEAKRWLSFTEQGGDNKGQVVEMFQKAVDGKAHGEAWCMSFVQYCVKMVDATAKEIVPQRTIPISPMEKSEHVMTTWFKSPQALRGRVPRPGRIAMWRHGSSSFGHCGIVVDVSKDGQWFYTIEGNTGPSNKEVVREGDGVYFKRRSIKGSGKMNVVGFLQPWV